MKKKGIKKLDAKEQQFVEAYLKHLNPEAAAIEAGYAKSTAHTKAYMWVSNGKTKPHVFAAVQKAKEKRLERTRIDADYILRRHEEIDRMRVSDILNDDFALKPISEWPAIWDEMLSAADVKELYERNEQGSRELIGYLKKLKWPDKLRNLEMMGKHVEVKAYSDTVKHEHGMDEATHRTLFDIIKGARRKEVKE